MLGYMHRHLGVPLDQLSFSSALPSSGREGVSVAFDYILWLHSERNIAVQTEGLVVRSLAAAAKFLFHSESKVRCCKAESWRPHLPCFMPSAALQLFAVRRLHLAWCPAWSAAALKHCLAALVLAGEADPRREPLQRPGHSEGASKHEQRGQETSSSGAPNVRCVDVCAPVCPQGSGWMWQHAAVARFYQLCVISIDRM